MTTTINTMPYCGGCGWDTRFNVHGDVFCDSCGDDLTMYGYAKPTQPLPPASGTTKPATKPATQPVVQPAAGAGTNPPATTGTPVADQPDLPDSSWTKKAVYGWCQSEGVIGDSVSYASVTKSELLELAGA